MRRSGNVTLVGYGVQPGDSPLVMGLKQEETGKQNTSLLRKVTFPFRVLLGSTAGERAASSYPQSGKRQTCTRLAMQLTRRAESWFSDRLLLLCAACVHVDQEPDLAKESWGVLSRYSRFAFGNLLMV